MNTRGRGRLFQRERSSYWWISYYAHGKEEREVARHVRTGEKIEAMEKNRHEAERWLKRVGRFGFLTGWRKGSIESLRWSDVGDGVIYLQAKNSKGRKAETMPLEGELGAIIERRRSAQVLEDGNGTNRLAEFVFHRDGQPIGDFRKAWATARKKANVDHKLFHDLRRTASRNMIVAGVPQAVAMKITGHRTDSMFRRYAIVNEEQKREALAKTQQHLAASAGRKVVTMGK